MKVGRHPVDAVLSMLYSKATLSLMDTFEAGKTHQEVDKAKAVAEAYREAAIAVDMALGNWHLSG
jgi:hypothetical protein